jgi:DNA-binding GntR family transcriptional regulator
MEVRYTELANALVKLITEGGLQVGERLPSELALAEQYQVSRTTVRSALNVVEGLGLIGRKRRAGTVVLSKETSKRYTKSLHTIEDLVTYASYTERTVIEISTAASDERLAEALECKPGQVWLKVRMLRTEKNAERTPVCWTDAYLDPKEGHAILPLIQNGSGLLCDLIEQNTGRAVMDVKQQISATSIPAEMAGHLHAVAHAPGLEITRHYIDQAKQKFLITVSTYPADKFKYTFWLHRSRETGP